MSEPGSITQTQALFPRRQGGAALLLVLLLVAIISILAVNSSENSYHLQRRLTMQEQQQAISSELLAIEQFSLEYFGEKIDSTENSHPKQPWFEPYSLPITDSKVQLRLALAKPCINLYGISDFKLQHLQQSPSLQQLQYLIENTSSARSTLDLQLVHRFASEIVQHSQPDPIANKAELARRLLAHSWTTLQWEKLSDFVCFRPNKYNRWNINAFSKADTPLLQALLLNQLDRERVVALIAKVNQKPLSHNHQFWQLDELQTIELPSQIKLQLQLRSEYYWLKVNVNRSHHKQAQWWFLQQQNQVLKKRFSYRM
ncbi:type II secretion system protein GspK [uncultured Pseudoteredinibacter sp.]|uniref:type II secretion system protein GspK n=1 Tax=uncultured Pseudoteredinibacter sp. TaxID=1641701 RepID=UPI002612FD12|nr:type II secretion system protein GspK [uncultured Pseudoteredinibacter sp.]